MTSCTAVRSENVVLGLASYRSKRKLYPGNRAGFSLPSQHFDQGPNPTLWIQERNLPGSPIKERHAAFGPHCAQHVDDHSCRDIKTLLDTQMDLQGLHSGKIYKYITVLILCSPRRTVYIRMVTQVLFLFFFFFFAEKEWKYQNLQDFGNLPPSTDW